MHQFVGVINNLFITPTNRCMGNHNIATSCYMRQLMVFGPPFAKFIQITIEGDSSITPT